MRGAARHVRPGGQATRALALLLSGCAVLPACGRAGLMRSTPHERYSAMLRTAGLDRTGLGADWTRASLNALQRPVEITTPFRETGYLPATEAAAIGYRFQAQRGRRLAIETTFESSAPARLFADLFRLSPGEPPEHVASLDDNQSQLVHDVVHEGAYVLRLQPELFRGGRFTIVQRTLAMLRFPISGRTTDTVQSAFGSARDAGARTHQGIDIFVPKGTPTVAVVPGIARTSVNTLGGNVVWLHDPAGRRTFYYAHLDRWAIDGVATVRAGDVLGTSATPAMRARLRLTCTSGSTNVARLIPCRFCARMTPGRRRRLRTTCWERLCERRRVDSR